MNKQFSLVQENIEKTEKAFVLLADSIHRIQPFDPSRSYSPEELEPYDALSSRFERTVEICIAKCFRSFEMYVDGISEGSIRDILLRMEKRGIILRSVDEWIGIRNLRNKIAHEYIPEERKEMYDIIIDFFPEIEGTLQRIKASITKT